MSGPGYFDHQRPEVQALIPRGAKRILDVGCGTGRLGEALKARQECAVYGIEPVSTAATEARKRLDHVTEGQVEFALEGLEDGYFDCIVLADVLEHMVHPWSVLGQLKGKLVPGGKVIASIPNVRHWSVLSSLIEGSWRYEREGLLDRTHLRFFTRQSIAELFAGAGLKVERVETTTQGAGPPARVAKALRQAGLAVDSLEGEGRVFQYLVVAERPIPKTSPDEWPKIGIVVLNLNRKQDTLECLESVERLDYPDALTIVVDNGSSDGSVVAIRKRFPAVEVIETGKNLGYAGGNNPGIKHSLEKGAEYILLLNNDVIVDSQVLNAFVAASELYPSAGIMGATNYYYSTPDKVWAMGAMWNSEESMYCLIRERAHDNRGRSDRYVEIDAAIGSAMLVRASVIRAIGYLEPEFFLSWEEYDYCARAHRAGFKCISVADARVWHKVGATPGSEEQPMRVYFNSRNHLLWAKRNMARGARIELYKKVYYELCPRFTVNGGKQHPLLKRLYWSVVQFRAELSRRYKNPAYRARLWGVRDYVLGRSGNCPEGVMRLSGKSVQEREC